MRIEIRGNQVLLDGYVNAILRDSRPLPGIRGRFVEQIEPKVFERALIKAENIDLLFNHDTSRKLGSTKEGNLELFEDNIGLRAICTITDEEVIEKAKNKQLQGWSFGFIANKDRWEETKDGISRRFIEDLDLLEVSVLDKTPAYIATSIESRDNKECLNEKRGQGFETIVTEEIKLNEERKNPIDYSSYENEIANIKIKSLS